MLLKINFSGKNKYSTNYIFKSYDIQKNLKLYFKSYILCFLKSSCCGSATLMVSLFTDRLKLKRFDDGQKVFMRLYNQLSSEILQDIYEQ
jgi:hypothetical protein